MIKAVIFDMDGLMFDTEMLSLRYWHTVFDIHHIEAIEEFLIKIRGLNKKASAALFKEYYPNENCFSRLREEKDALVQKYIKENGVPIKEGLIELLEYLKGNGYKIVLATSTENKVAVQYLKQANVYQYFTDFCFGDEVICSKPNPEIFLRAAKKVDVNPECCLVLEDSKSGVEAAGLANMNIIWIPDLVLFKTDALKLNNLKEVIEVLKNKERGKVIWK